MLVNTISSASQMRDEFIRYDRDYYTNEGYEIIFDYFNEFEEPIEFDVIGICGDFNEDTFEEFINNYNVDVSYVVDDEEVKECIINYLDNNGGFYQITSLDTIVYTAF